MKARAAGYLDWLATQVTIILTGGRDVSNDC